MEKSVAIKSGRYELAGVLSLPGGKTGKQSVVLMCHGFGGTKSESHFIYTKTARRLAKMNIASLRFDFMGSGDSQGRFENMTLNTEMRDAENVLAFLKSLDMFDINRTGVLGLSMGAVSASYAASSCGLKSLVLWSPVAFLEGIGFVQNLTATRKRKLAVEGKAYFPEIGHYLGKKFFESVQRVDPLEYSRTYRGNVLIIHTKDQDFSLEHPLAYFQAFHKNALLPQLLVLDEGGHTFSTEFSEKTVIEETAAFFCETLK